MWAWIGDPMCFVSPLAEEEEDDDGSRDEARPHAKASARTSGTAPLLMQRVHIALYVLMASSVPCACV